jgi:hypothetical protein
LEKFERISKKIVNLLARPPAAASLLQRGAPTRRASVIFSRAIFSLASFEQGKDFIVSLPRPPVRGHGNSLYDTKKHWPNSTTFGHEKWFLILIYYEHGH